VFVTFYGGVCGLATKAELGLAKPSDDPASVYSVGQVVRVRVIGADAGSGRIRLSLRSGSGTATGVGSGAAEAPADHLGGLQPGAVIERAKVVRVDGGAGGGGGGGGGGATALVLEVASAAEGASSGKGGGMVQARLELPGHLADHPGAAAALLPLASQPGAVIGEPPTSLLELLHVGLNRMVGENDEALQWSWRLI
jgi:hypothetical protein